MTEIVAEAPARAKSAAKARTKAQAPTTSTAGEPIPSHEQQLRRVAQLLDEARMCDESHYSGDSDRLLQAASDIANGAADRLHYHAEVPNGVRDLAFNIGAQICAARLVPGDTESPERAELIQQAGAILVSLEGSDRDIADFIEPHAPRPARLWPLDDAEQTVVDMLAKLMCKVEEITDLGPRAGALIRMAKGKLAAPAGTLDDYFADVAALIAGAIELDKAEGIAEPEVVDAMKKALELAETTSLSYHCKINAAVACADGIRAAEAAGSAPTTLNAAQFVTVLQHIAGHADTLHKTLRLLQADEVDAWTEAVAIDACALMARTLGAMADDASGGQIIGNANRWHYGPNFTTAGKAGAA